MLDIAKKPDCLEARGQKRGAAWQVWLAVLTAALVLYVCTLAPDVVWQDQGDYQYQAARCNLHRPGDVVRVHPLFIILAHGLGRLGVFSYAYAANLVSAITTALTVANVFLLVYWLTGRWWPGILSAAVFAMAHSVWFLAVQAQSYGPANAAMSAGVLLTAAYIQTGRRHYLYWMGFIFGIGITAHMMSQIAFIVIVVWLLVECVRRRLAVYSLLLVLFLWVLGAGLLWVVMVQEYLHTDSLWLTIQSALWGRWGMAVFNLNRVGVLAKRSMQFFVLNFPTPLVLLAAPGAWLSGRKMVPKTLAWLLGCFTVLYAVFAFRYDVRNQNNFFLPMYLFVSVYIGLGFHYLADIRRKRGIVISLILLIGLIPTYRLIAHVAEKRKLDLGTRRHIPYRNVYQYYLLPWQQGQTGPRRFGREMFTKLPPAAVLVADSTTIPLFRYMQEIEEKRPDVTLVGIGADMDFYSLLREGIRIFVLSDVDRYYPQWILHKEWLQPFSLSDTEHVFEVVIPQDDPVWKL